MTEGLILLCKYTLTSTFPYMLANVSYTWLYMVYFFILKRLNFQVDGKHLKMNI